MKKTISRNAFAKINLGLDVTGVREDGIDHVWRVVADETSFRGAEQFMKRERNFEHQSSSRLRK